MPWEEGIKRANGQHAVKGPKHEANLWPNPLHESHHSCPSGLLVHSAKQGEYEGRLCMPCLMQG